MTPETKCGFCTASKCCTYITHQIDGPRSKAEFDYLLWQVSHERVAVFKDDDGWFLLINNPCTHLLPDGRCGIYATRPQICREHSNDNCEFDANMEEEFELYFDSYEALLRYCKKRFKRWGA
ncbi:hypothetical protein Tel_03220 [Candidatus Tenderia electrophaga]|uniref:Uncharacterized protein n=1 Tax=Candidatus Tenderia electrophaga TaxID=1748243 RepID=A0A0S2THU5_9GAMM|nr:hypothetical protein Tel_03220 [Candidatus Tenderia electrophaga]